VNKKILIALIAVLPLVLMSCNSYYVSAAKPTKEGKILVVGSKQTLPLFIMKPKAWLVDEKTGEKTELEIEFE